MRFNSIEEDFGGGKDLSNVAFKKQLDNKKTMRPISANPHTRNGAISHLNSIKTPKNYRYDDSRRSLDRKSGTTKNNGRPTSTTAVTNPTYNSTMISQKFRNSVRASRGGYTSKMLNLRESQYSCLNKMINRTGPNTCQASTHSV